MRSKDYRDQFDACVGEATDDLSSEQLLHFFDRALQALLSRTEPNLGVVVLGAILERTLYTSSERFPFLRPLKIGSARFDFTGLYKQKPRQAKSEIIEAFRFLITDLISTVDRLTGELVSAPMAVELTTLMLAERRRASDKRKENK